jgi:hypothetical protein
MMIIFPATSGLEGIVLRNYAQLINGQGKFSSNGGGGGGGSGGGSCITVVVLCCQCYPSGAKVLNWYLVKMQTFYFCTAQV